MGHYSLTDSLRFFTFSICFIVILNFYIFSVSSSFKRIKNMNTHTSRQLRKWQRYFTEPYGNRETKEYYSSESTSSTARMRSRVRPYWKLLACTTILLMYMMTAPSLWTTRRRMTDSEDEQIQRAIPSNSHDREDEKVDVDPELRADTDDATFKVGDHVEAQYNNKWFAGNIVLNDEAKG